MATLVRIEQVRRTGRSRPHERISEVGGLAPNGVPWRLSHQEAVRSVEEDRWGFYVRDADGHREMVVVAESEDGVHYLKGLSDRSDPESLLGLPDLPDYSAVS